MASNSNFKGRGLLMKAQFYILFAFALCLINCDNKNKLEKFQDPYLDSFRDRGIKYMIAYSAKDTLRFDTTMFDFKGNIISVKEFMLREKRAYDSLNFITRKLSISDAPTNFSIRYKFDDNGSLLQQWFEYRHLQWFLDNSEHEKLFTVIRFKMDYAGRVIKEIDSLDNSYFNYLYNDRNKLSVKERFRMMDNKFLCKWIYLYDDRDQLKKIALIEDGKEIITHFYSGGLLDSTIDDGRVRKYKFIYY